MLTPPTSRRERTIIYGIENTGKSSTWLQIAAWLRRTGSPARVFAMDSDQVANWAPDVYPDIDKNVTFYDTFEWEDYEKGIDDAYTARSSLDDWLIVDTGDRPWGAVQDWYTRTVKETEVADWVTEHAKGDKSSQHPLAGEWGMNWFYINDRYNRWFQKVVRWRGHVLVCAHEQPLQRPKGEANERVDSKENLALFDAVGVRPSGQKGLSLPFQSIIRLTERVQRGKHERKMTTVKEKGREELQSAEWDDFVTDYLIGVAKWTL